MKISGRSFAVWILVAVMPCALWSAEASREIDAQKSVMTVRVFKTGLFSAFGHEHEISAPIRGGKFSESEHSVELTVDARQMRVLDREVSEKDRAEIQTTMLGPKVLDTARFPEIAFRSKAAESGADGRWQLKGELTLHGKTLPVKLEAHLQNGHYLGATQLKQSDFGIEPVSVGGGTVKVKDELRVEFDIVARQ